MKKIIFLILVTLISVTSLYSVDVGYKTAIMHDSFRQAINNLAKDSNNLEETTYKGEKAWRFLYNVNTVNALKDFGKVGESNGAISLTTFSDFSRITKYNSENDSSEEDKYPYQCVGFAKAASTLPDYRSGDSSNWKIINKTRVTKSNLPKPGTVIASFSGIDGKYDGTNDHIGIFIRGNSDYIYMLDQNIEIEGEIWLHILPFSGYGKNNAGNYYVVEY